MWNNAIVAHPGFYIIGALDSGKSKNRGTKVGWISRGDTNMVSFSNMTKFKGWKSKLLLF